MAQTFLSQTSLSSDGINVIVLSANDAAVAYNPQSPLTGTLTSYVFNGTVVLIDDVYIGSTMAVLKVPEENKQFSLVTLLSAGNYSVTPLSALAGVQIWTPRDRIMRLLGYY